jgi:sugar/nucleoside kinase (ribokinase family)
MLIVTLGDALLDVVVRLDEPLTAGADAHATSRTGAGGQAANVAAWTVELGGRGRCVAKRGDDSAGRLVAAELDERGVELVGPVGVRTGVVVSLVGTDGERTMASDRGDAPELEARELDATWFACDCLHISGYALLATPIDDAAQRAVELARGHGARISIDLSAWTQMRAYGTREIRDRVERLDPDMVFANEAEWDALGVGPRLAPTAVVKRGPRGIAILGEDEVELPAREAEVVDTTGAGDALAAGYLLGGAELALNSAARCLSKLGAMP